MGIMDKLMFWKKEDDLGLDLGEPKGGNLGMDTAGLDEKYAPGMPGSFSEPPGLDQPRGPDLGAPKNEFGSPHQPSFTPQQQSFQQPYQQQPAQSNDSYIMSKDIEIISSKLDALKAAMESINQRLANLERIASGEDRKRSW